MTVLKIPETQLEQFRAQNPTVFIDVAPIREEHVVYDSKVITMLADLYVKASKFEECEALLLRVINEAFLDETPLDLLVKLSASQLFVGKVRPNLSA